MKKKVLCGILAMMVLLAHTAALGETAGAAPSPTGSRIRAVSAVAVRSEQAAEGQDTSAEQAEVMVQTTENTALVDGLLTEIKATVQEAPIAEFFGEEAVKQAVDALLSAAEESAEDGQSEAKGEMPGADDIAGNLVLAEIWTIHAELPASAAPEEDGGESLDKIEIIFDFDLDYPEDALLMGMMGIVNDEGVTEWTGVAAEPVDGRVKMTFTQEAMQKLLGSDEVILVLLRVNTEDVTG